MAGRSDPTTSYRVDSATLADLDEIMAIERSSFSAPWTPESIADEIERVWSIFRVLRDTEGKILAYLNFWVIHDEIHILNLATHPHHRRRGLALRLMVELLDEAQRSASSEIHLEVRSSNFGAQQLYEGLQFTRIGVRKGYYADSGEDALIYARRLTSPE